MILFCVSLEILGRFGIHETASNYQIDNDDFVIIFAGFAQKNNIKYWSISLKKPSFKSAFSFSEMHLNF